MLGDDAFDRIAWVRGDASRRLAGTAGASVGQLSLSDGAAGQVSLADDSSGRLSLPDESESKGRRRRSARGDAQGSSN